jgi:predicted nucleic acid-binding protein
MAGDFLDTNVLIYQFSTDVRKAERAESLLRGGGTISVQVLNEFANVARRRMMLGWDEIHSLLDTVRALLDVVPVDVETHADGMRLCERYGFSVYDGIIVAAALRSGCETLWTEDMQHGLRIGSLALRNPFAG